MDDEDIFDIDSAGELTEQSAMEEQRASLQTFLDSLPYECEADEEMQTRLEEIVQKIYICARTKNWLVLSMWDGMLQWYVIIILIACATHFPSKLVINALPYAKVYSC
jgi:proteasome activator subunit 4